MESYIKYEVCTVTFGLLYPPLSHIPSSNKGGLKKENNEAELMEVSAFLMGKPKISYHCLLNQMITHIVSLNTRKLSRDSSLLAVPTLLNYP